MIDGPANAPERALLPDRGASTLTNWYLGNPHHVEQFKTSDGKVLRDSAMQNLVPAMAALSPPAPGQITLVGAYATELNPVIAANWH